MSEESPFNAVAPVVVLLFLAMAGLEAMFSLGAAGVLGGQDAVGWRQAAIEDYGFSPLVWDQIVLRGDWSFDLVKRLVTYPFVHGSFTQTLFGAALLLALGKFVGDVFSGVSVLIVFVVSAIAGALAFGAVEEGRIALVGAYTPVYGLIGAFTYVMWLRLGSLGENRLRAFRLIGFLMAVQLVFGVLFGGSTIWIAEVAGFLAGFGISVLVAPGGWTTFLARVRQR